MLKINDRVKFKSEHQYAGAVGQVESVQPPFDDRVEPGAALVKISGFVNNEPVSLTDWFFFDDLEIA